MSLAPIVGCKSPARICATGCLSLLWCLAGATPLLAEGADAPVTATQAVSSVALQSAIERALANDSGIAVLNAAVAAAKERALAARDRRNPELSLSYGEGSGDETRRRAGTQSFPTNGVAAVDRTSESLGSVRSDGDMYRVGVRLFPANPWERAAGVSAMAAELRAAEADLAAAQWVVTVAVRQQAAELNYLEKDFALLVEAVRLRNEVLQTVKERAAQGQVTITDLMVASRRYLTAISDRDQGLRRQQETRRALGSALNLPAAGLSIRHIPMTTVPSTNLQADVWEQKALESRAELRAMAWRTAAAKAIYRKTRSANIPWFRNIEAMYGWSRQDTTGTQSGSELGVLDGDLQNVRTDINDSSNDQEWRIDAAITIPIFAWANHEDKAMWAEFKMAALAETEAIKKAAREIRDALTQWQAMQSEWQRYIREIDPIVRQMQESVDGFGEESSLTPEEIFEVKLQVIEARRSKLRTAFDYQVAALNLESVLGTPLSNAF